MASFARRRKAAEWGEISQAGVEAVSGATAESTRLAGFEVVEHAPDAIQFATLHHLQGCRAVEGGIGVREPTADLRRFDHPGEAVEQTIHFDQGFFLFGRRCFTSAPLGDRARREAGETNKLRLGDVELGAVGFEQTGVIGRATVLEAEGNEGGLG